MLLGMRSTLLSSFSPAALFAAGEQGVWYDPSDMTTLFTTSAGTTPVTAVETAVGLMLDKRSGVSVNPILQKYGSLPGTATNHFSTPDSAANSITGDIDIRALIAPTDWTPSAVNMLVAKWNAGTTNRSYLFYIAATTGVLIVAVSPDGTSVNATSFASTVAPTVSDGSLLWVRATVDVNNGSGGKTAVFYTSSDGVSWNQLGDVVTSAGTTSIFNSNAILSVGSTSGVADWFAGRIYRAQIYNGINGTLAVDFCPPYNWVSGTWNSTLTSETWTANGTATIVSIGNHATQSIDAARPVLSARVNLLTKTEQFNDAAWNTVGSSVTANSIVAPDGTTTADTLSQDGAASSHDIGQYVASQTSGQSYAISVYLKKGTVSLAQLTLGGAAHAYVNFDLNAGTIVGSGNSPVSSGIQSVGDGWYRCYMVVTSSVTTATGGIVVGFIQNANDGRRPSFTGNAANNFYIWGADLRVANDTALPVYQRVNTSTDYDTTGFPMYLRFDGSDDSMATGSINFTSTAQMTVFAGVRKLSDAVVGVVTSLGTYISGNTFELQAPNTSAATNYQWAIHGNGANITDNDFNVYRFNATSPTTNVVTGTADRSIANTSGVSANNNGVLAARVATTFTGSNISGNFDNAALTVGRRSGAAGTLFNGRIYSLIVRGAATSAADITATETWVNGKTKAY